MPGLDQNYKISEAFISADKFGAAEIDVSNRIFELTIFESIEKSYLTGNVVIVDDASIFDYSDFNGSEKLTVTISPLTGDDNQPPFVKKTFAMTRMLKRVKPNDNSETIMFHLDEDHYFLNSTKLLSRSYTDKLEKIATKIMAFELQRDIDLSYLNDNGSAQGTRRVIVPYLTPIEACRWLLDRATTSTGSPLFMYSSIHDDNIRMGDLDKMLGQESFNFKTPFVYSQAASQTSTGLDPVSEAMAVSSYSNPNGENSIGMLDHGSIGSFYSNTDVGSGITYRSHFSADDMFESFKTTGVLPKNAKQLIYDERQKVDEAPISDVNSVFYHQISSRNTYGRFKSYADEDTAADHMLRVKSKALKNTLYKNKVNIIVSGVAFFLAKATVGDIVRVNFIANNTADQSGDEIYDKKKTGDYLIHSTRHTFRDTSHNVSMDISRIHRD